MAGLDGLRGIAACVVAFGFHIHNFYPPGAFTPAWGGIAGIWMDRFGWTAVDLFFVLSGFVFAHVNLSQPQAMKLPGALRAFWVSRIARLYPLHILMLVITASLFWQEPNNKLSAFVANVFMVQGFVAIDSFDGPSWSISVEFACYAVFAAAARQGMTAVRLAAIIGVACGAAGVVLAGNLVEHTVLGDVSRGALGFFAGQMLWLIRGFLIMVPTVAFAALSAGLVTAAWFAGDAGRGMILLLSLGAWPALIMVALRSSLCASPALVWLGDRSYAIYLINMPLVFFIAYSTGGLAEDRISILAAQILLVAANLALADLVYRHFELPMQRAVQRQFARHSTVRWASPA
ncbi:MAG: acyltransferase [Proteobacteria bacterium]|nr:acyltransferase [Pseudomonadota bacterium]